MPPDAEPNTMLSRVVPHEAYLAMSASVMPYLSKIFFSLAMISGDASVSAMKPSFTDLVSGPAACAKAPDGRAARAALSNAAVAVAPLRTPRRPNVVVLVMSVLLNANGWKRPSIRSTGGVAHRDRPAAGGLYRGKRRPSRRRRRDKDRCDRRGR